MFYVLIVVFFIIREFWKKVYDVVVSIVVNRKKNIDVKIFMFICLCSGRKL